MIAWLVLLFVAVSCSPPLTPAERDCLAIVEAHEDAELLACGKDVSGECATDAIMDRHDEAARRCVK